MREIDRTELYLADEVFLCGTAFEITPVAEVDLRVGGAVRIVTTDVSSATSVDEWMAGQLDGRVSLRPGGGDQVPAMLTTVPLGRDIASAGVRA